MIKNIQDDGTKWKTFWDSFGKNIKMGIVEDSSNRDELSRICQFYTSKSLNTEIIESSADNSMTTLDAYAARMRDGQSSIYYFATSNIKNAINAPFVEKLIKKGYEVLLMTDPLDEYVVMNLAKFKSTNSDKEFDLVDVTRENAEIENDSDEQIAFDKAEKEYRELCIFIKNVLGEKVEKVSVSSRLDSSPCVLVTSKFGWSANMEQIMKAQAGSDARAYDYMRGRRSLEINPNSRINRNLLEEIKKDEDSEKARSAIKFIYQATLLTSGFEIEEPQVFARTVLSLLDRSLAEKNSKSI
jgi:HSP90 family molecular chaperone